MKCTRCGSSEIEEDLQRADTACVNCGYILTDSAIVSEVQFEEAAHGGSNVVGQFLSADAKSATSSFGANFHVSSQDSQQNTLAKGMKHIQSICQELNIGNHIVSTSYNYLKMALVQHNFTRGRKRNVVYSACIYLACRTERTKHMLIDISDAANVCVIELGRTYLKLSQLFLINIPSVDPCLYVVRFAMQLELGKKTHEVSMLALRIVQRMKRDNIHVGRRPSGLCGAALLLAARLHDFHRTVNDIVQIVKIHHSTLKKRLQEFRETPSSSLTVDEFMTVDLEDEEDPPSFRDSRKKDKERVQKILEDNPAALDVIRAEIEKQLEFDYRKNRKKFLIDSSDSEDDDKESKFDNVASCTDLEKRIKKNLIDDTTYEIVEEYIIDNPVSEFDTEEAGIGPDIDQICNVAAKNEASTSKIEKADDLMTGEDLSDIDDAEINTYLLSEEEAQYKRNLWTKMNESYITAQKNKKEMLAKESESQPEKKRKRTTGPRKKKDQEESGSAGEAVEKMLNEKKLSSLINYDVLKSLEIGF